MAYNSYGQTIITNVVDYISNIPLKLGETSSWGGGGGIYEKGIHRGCTVDIFIPRIVMLCKINTTQKVPPPPPPEHYVAIFH